MTQAERGDPARAPSSGSPASASTTASGPPACCPTPPWASGTSSATSRPTPRPGRWSPPSPAPATPTSPSARCTGWSRRSTRSDESGGAAAALLAGLRGSGLLRSRLLVRPRAPAPGWPTTSPPTRRDWAVLDDDGDGFPRGSDRPSAKELERRHAGRRRRRPRRPAVGRAAGQGRPGRVAEADRRPPAGLPARHPVARRPRPGRRTAGRGGRLGAGRHRRRRAAPPAWRSPSPSSLPTPRPAGSRSSRSARPAGAS